VQHVDQGRAALSAARDQAGQSLLKRRQIVLLPEWTMLE